MSWNYRIVRHKWQLKDMTGYDYSIRDVYYDEDGKPHSWGAEPQTPIGETKADLIADLACFQEALSKPVLGIFGGELKEIDDKIEGHEKEKTD